MMLPSIPFIFEPYLKEKRILAEDIARMYEEMSNVYFSGGLAGLVNVGKASVAESEVGPVTVVGGNSLDAFLSMDTSQAEQCANESFRYMALSQSLWDIRFRTVTSLRRICNELSQSVAAGDPGYTGHDSRN